MANTAEYVFGLQILEVQKGYSLLTVLKGVLTIGTGSLTVEGLVVK